MSRDLKLNAGLGGLLLAAIVLSCFLGTTPMAAARVVAAFIGAGTPTDTLIVWEIRLPRATTAMIVGFALGCSGAALQGLLRNPMAEPGGLGVSASAALGATFSIYFGLTAVSIWALPLLAIGGALGATLLIAAFAMRHGSIVALILVGVALSSFAGALMSLLMNFAPNPFTLSDMINWMLGTVANRSFHDIGLIAPFMGAGLALLFLHRRGLSTLTLGEEAASGIGADLKRLRLAVVLGSGLATGAAVAVAGAIGFIGIVAPHFVRPFVAHDPARTLLPSGLLGGLILVLADIGVRLAPTTVELKLGVVAALIGAPAFAWIASRRGMRHG
jgi:iron complex transport system permease protein